MSMKPMKTEFKIISPTLQFYVKKTGKCTKTFKLQHMKTRKPPFSCRKQKPVLSQRCSNATHKGSAVMMNYYWHGASSAQCGQ